MTVIAGIVDANGKVYLGADRAFHDEYILTVSAQPKIYKLNNEVMVGFAGNLEVTQAIIDFEPPEHPKGVKDFIYISTHFVQALKQHLIDSGIWTDGVIAVEMEMLLAYHGHIYNIGPKLEVLEPLSGYTAAGTGSMFALGSLYATSDLVVTSERLRIALQAAEALDAYVRGPFDIECI